MCIHIYLSLSLYVCVYIYIYDHASAVLGFPRPLHRPTRAGQRVYVGVGSSAKSASGSSALRS